MQKTKINHPLSELSFLKPIDIKEVKTTPTDKDTPILETKPNNQKCTETFFSPIKDMAHSLKTQIVDLMDEFEKSRQSWQTFNALNAPKKAPFSLRLHKKRRPFQVDFVADKENNTTVPVIRRPIESAWQITDSKSLLSYCSDWVKSLFFDKAELRALPGTGTILIILPHGNLRFVQFIYKDTPIHPTQQAFQEKISPVEVSIFRDFKSFRDWMYDQISHA